MKGNAPGTEACESKLSGLKERNDRLFLEVGKCIKNASKSAELKTCNDRYNPRYRKVATERRAAREAPQVAIKTGQVSETDSEHLMTRFNALSDKLKDPFCPGKHDEYVYVSRVIEPPGSSKADDDRRDD